uniref:Uncharacterized protein n=1 Tax=Arundo donax TaxID=35708 RepID=A0A0A9B6T8_ARUDO
MYHMDLRWQLKLRKTGDCKSFVLDLKFLCLWSVSELSTLRTITPFRRKTAGISDTLDTRLVMCYLMQPMFLGVTQH